MSMLRILIVLLLALVAGTSLAAEAADEEPKCEKLDIDDPDCEKKLRDGRRVDIDRRRGPGEIWVGSPEVFTRERLVNEQLMQDVWLRGKLDEEPDEEFGFQGIVDMRSFFGLSSRTGVEADPNLLSLYQAETQSTLADMRRRQQQNALQNEIDRLEKLKTIRQLHQDLESGDADDSGDGAVTSPSTSDGGDGSGGDGDGSGGGGDGAGGETTPAIETEEASPSAPQPPATGIDRTIGFLDRLMEERSGDLLPDPSSPTRTQAEKSPLDDFRDRLAYREEIRNEIFENALDDRHDLRGNTAYRLNFDATILPKKKVDAWAVVEVQVKEGEPEPSTVSVHTSGDERRCLRKLKETYDLEKRRLPTGDELDQLLPSCAEPLDLARVRTYWNDARRAQEEFEEARTAAPSVSRIEVQRGEIETNASESMSAEGLALEFEGHPQPPGWFVASSTPQELAEERARGALDNFLEQLSQVTGSWYYDLKTLPSWEEVEDLALEACEERRRKVEVVCREAISATPETRVARAEDERLYERWLRDFEQQANRLLTERWAWARDCLLNGDGRIKTDDDEDDCVGDAHLGHEIAAYAQRHLDLKVLAPELVIQSFTFHQEPASGNGNNDKDVIASEWLGEEWLADVPIAMEDLRPLIEKLAKVASSDEAESVEIRDVRYSIKRIVGPEELSNDSPQLLLQAPLDTWEQLINVKDEQVRRLAAEIEDTYFWEEPGEAEGIKLLYDVSLLEEDLVTIAVSTQPSIHAFDFGLSGGWNNLYTAEQRLQPGDADILEVGGAEVTVRKDHAGLFEIYVPSGVEFHPNQTPEPYRDFAHELGKFDSPAAEKSQERESNDNGQAKASRPSRLGRELVPSRLRTRGDRSKKIFRQAVEATSNKFPACQIDGQHGHDKALGFLLVNHLRWTLSTSQGLGEFLTLEDPGCDCAAKAIKICRKGKACKVEPCEKDSWTDSDSWGGAGSWEDDDSWAGALHEERYWDQFDAFRRTIEDRAHVYAFAATPKETVQRISEVAARRSTIELAALVSTLQTGAKIDNVTELVLDSQRILHGIARQPLVVGFTHGLNFASGPDTPATSAKAAQAGWMIGPKFHISEAAWNWPWAKGFGYRHSPVQNNLSVAISVPSWWEHAEVAVTTYWRSLKNKTRGDARRHRHRIELPGSTAGITDALAERKLPEVFEPKEYVVVQGAPARLLLIGDNLWRSTRVTLGGQVADEITVLPALAGLVAKFKQVEELASPDGKTPRSKVPIHVWTSTGKRLAGVATVHPAKGTKKVAPKLTLSPPYFIKGGKVSAKLTAGEVPKAERVEMQVRVLDERTKLYGPPIVLGVPTLDAATKTYSVEPDWKGDTLKVLTDARVRVLLVITPEAEGKIETLSCEKLGVFYASKPTIGWKNPEKTTGELTLTTPAWTDIAFPEFTSRTGVKVAAKAPPELGSVELKNSVWSTESEGRFVLKSFLDFRPKDPNASLSSGQKVKIQPTLTDAGLKQQLSIVLEDGGKEEIVVP